MELSAMTVIAAIISPQLQRDDEGNTIKTSRDERKPDRGSAMKNGLIGKCRDTSLPRPNSPEEQTTGEIQRQVIEENEKRREIYKSWREEKEANEALGGCVMCLPGLDKQR